MNTFAELLALLKTVFADEISLQGITEKTPLNTLGISYVGYLYLALAVEERFGVRFSNADFVAFSTVGDVVRRIEQGHAQ